LDTLGVHNLPDGVLVLYPVIELFGWLLEDACLVEHSLLPFKSVAIVTVVIPSAVYKFNIGHFYLILGEPSQRL
jgi:hypothetical protein